MATQMQQQHSKPAER